MKILINKYKLKMYKNPPLHQNRENTEKLQLLELPKLKKQEYINTKYKYYVHFKNFLQLWCFASQGLGSR